MGLDGVNGKVIESLDVSKSKGRKKKKLQDRVMEDEENETGCWHSFRFIGSCISSRLKSESKSIIDTTSNHQGCENPLSKILYENMIYV
jgi:hypothetical protein